MFLLLYSPTKTGLLGEKGGHYFWPPPTRAPRASLQLSVCSNPYDTSHSVERPEQRLRHWSVRHIRKTNSPRGSYHSTSAVGCFLPQGIKLLTWAMGADRRWASERHWWEPIKERGRWRRRRAVCLTEWQGAFFTWTSSNERTLSSACMTYITTFICHNL